MKPNITKKQEEVLTFVKKFIVEHGYPPSVREIGAGLGLSSPATVHAHLTQLELNIKRLLLNLEQSKLLEMNLLSR